jgi:hypothetical protein
VITISQLRRRKGKSWANKPSDGLSSLEILAWHAASDLATFVEMTSEPEDFAHAFPETYIILMGLEAYFATIRQLPPRPLAHLMLMHRRVMAGLTARGEDRVREKPSK